MIRRACTTIALVVLAMTSGGTQPPASSHTGVELGGELRQWHKVTLALDGPQADENSTDPNPFRDYRMTVTFAHESGGPTYNIPGYFAADGNAANPSATGGTKWRAHLSPDRPGRWTWRISFVRGRDAAIDAVAASQSKPVVPFDGLSGSFQVAVTDKTAPDVRARGRLEYVGGHYLRFAGTGEYFLKVGADAPETLLAYADFDDTVARKQAVPLHTYAPHVADWTSGDPIWKDGKGKGLIGAIDYLSSKGVNSMSFLTYNAGGDGDNVWPFVRRDDKLHYDVSKLDQWQIVFDHAQRKGLHLHFKLQETENDDNYRGDYRDGRPPGGLDTSAAQGADRVTESLDGGALGPERRLYLREIIARFGYELALNWNLGEENTQSSAEQRAMAGYIRSRSLPAPRRHPHAPARTGPDLPGAARRAIGAERRVAPERLERRARADAEVDRGVAQGGQALGGRQRRAGGCPVRGATRPGLQGLCRQGPTRSRRPDGR